MRDAVAAETVREREPLLGTAHEEGRREDVGNQRRRGHDGGRAEVRRRLARAGIDLVADPASARPSARARSWRRWTPRDSRGTAGRPDARGRGGARSGSSTPRRWRRGRGPGSGLRDRPARRRHPRRPAARRPRPARSPCPTRPPRSRPRRGAERRARGRAPAGRLRDRWPRAAAASSSGVGMRPAPRRSHARTRGATVGSKARSVRAAQRKTSARTPPSSGSTAISSPTGAALRRESGLSRQVVSRFSTRRISATTSSDASSPASRLFATTAISRLVPMEARRRSTSARPDAGRAARRGSRPPARASRASVRVSFPPSLRLFQIGLRFSLNRKHTCVPGLESRRESGARSALPAARRLGMRGAGVEERKRRPMASKRRSPAAAWTMAMVQVVAFAGLSSACASKTTTQAPAAEPAPAPAATPAPKPPPAPAAMVPDQPYVGTPRPMEQRYLEIIRLKRSRPDQRGAAREGPSRERGLFAVDLRHPEAPRRGRLGGGHRGDARLGRDSRTASSRVGVDADAYAAWVLTEDARRRHAAALPPERAPARPSG